MTAAAKTPQASGQRRMARWGALLCTTAAAAAIVAFSSGPGSYSVRLVDLDARSSLARDIYAVASDSPELRALFLDVSDSPQLLAKMQFALENYPTDARDVLIAFGGYEDFQKALQDYGEGIVPIIAFFQKTELKTMKLRFEAGRGWDWLLGKGKTDPDKIYGPEYRGLFAIQAIRLKGHEFLEQFDLNDQKKAVWLVTPQVTDLFKTFFTSGMATVERKVRLHEELVASDLAWAAADVFFGASLFKALKGLKAVQPIEAAAATGKVARPVAMADKAVFYGNRVLSRDRVAKALKLTGAAAAVYITVRHPSLLSGLFEDIGAWLGLSPLVSKLIGWALVLAPFVIWLLPAALGAVSALVPLALALARLGAWLRGQPESH